MKITMIGTGYVGLVSGICFSDFRHEVVCVDKAEEKIAMLERGEVSRLAETMAAPKMADLRNIYTRADALAAGFTAYDSVGR